MSEEYDAELDRIRSMLSNLGTTEIPDGTQHKDGIDWMDAPLPRRFHKCFVQTSGYVGLFDLVQRCACGAIRNPGISRSWMDKNSRRKSSR